MQLSTQLYLLRVTCGVILGLALGAFFIKCLERIAYYSDDYLMGRTKKGNKP